MPPVHRTYQEVARPKFLRQPANLRVPAVADGESSDAIPEDRGREITVQEGETATVDLLTG